MRDLNWAGSRNLRDLGGLLTQLSPTGTTLTGRIARGTRRETLAAAGWVSATAWGLNSIVDLRNKDEVGPRPGDPAVAPPTTITVTRAPTEDQAHPEFRATCFPILDSPEYWQHNIRILPHLVRGALEAIAGARPGILVHCSAGRDRTGMICALLLANSGVAAADIVDDWAASVRAMAGTAGHGGGTNDRQAFWTETETEDWIQATGSHVSTFATDPSRALDRIGVSNGVRARLRELLTEPVLSR